MVKTVVLDADPRLDSTAPESMGATVDNEPARPPA